MPHIKDGKTPKKVKEGFAVIEALTNPKDSKTNRNWKKGEKFIVGRELAQTLAEQKRAKILLANPQIEAPAKSK